LMSVRPVFLFGVFVYLQLRVGRRRPGSVPLVWFAWASEILPEDRRAVWVGLSLSVVDLPVTARSDLEVFRSSS
jgi:hypothetical protein